MALRWLIALIALAGCAPTPALLPRASDGPLIIVKAADGQSTRFQPVGRNGDVTSWQSPDGAGLATAQGVLIGTRGLGFDLIVADTVGARSGTYTRQFRHLDGDFGLTRLHATCTSYVQGSSALATVSGTVIVRNVTERCKASGHEINNSYAIGAGGRVWQSRQWVSPQIGYLEITLVRP